MPQVKKSEIDAKLKVLNEELEKLHLCMTSRDTTYYGTTPEFRFEYGPPRINRLILFKHKDENFKGQQHIAYGTQGELYKYITIIFEALRGINNIIK